MSHGGAIRIIMFLDKLEKLIDEAIADGGITEKDRASILKKAEKYGLDPEEYNLYIDAKIQFLSFPNNSDNSTKPNDNNEEEEEEEDEDQDSTARFFSSMKKVKRDLKKVRHDVTDGILMSVNKQKNKKKGGFFRKLFSRD